MKTNEQQETVVYDIRGQICPSCLLFTLREINEQKTALRENSIQIIIKTDNRDATTTIPDAVTSMGYDCLVGKKDGYYEIIITKNNKTKLSE